jgi:hypothetical protein
MTLRLYHEETPLLLCETYWYGISPISGFSASEVVQKLGRQPAISSQTTTLSIVSKNEPFPQLQSFESYVYFKRFNRSIAFATSKVTIYLML